MMTDEQETRVGDRLFAGGGEMGALMRSYDWSQTPLGAVEQWSQSLKTAVRIMLTSRQPMFVWWGKELINLYNDAYQAIVGGKHPKALGQPAAEVWSEIWDQVGPRAESAMLKNEGTYDEALLLIMERNGYPEETYYTFSYSPIPDDQGNTSGILCANTNDTQRIIDDRQLVLLRELAVRTADVRTFDDVCKLSASCLEANAADLPFAMIYLVDPDRSCISLAGTCGIDRQHEAAIDSVALDADSVWSFGEVIKTQRAYLVSNLETLFDNLPTGVWQRSPYQALVIPLGTKSNAEEDALGVQLGRAGVLVIGLNPFRLLDDNYQRFIDLVAAQISASLANANAYEEERKRTEALAELNHAKTTFFSNVSHEFRTPLTLMLSPLEDSLAGGTGELPQQHRETLEIVHRNGLRLLKLVNTLLDFSRIEAGRNQAVYEPTDVSSLTTELASVFRAAIERAGLRLIVDCTPLAEWVYVDRDLWEKIVLNLLSNAFKFTFEGDITVRLKTSDRQVILTVQDTGAGIPPNELSHLFKRFHRVVGTRARTYEGSGIGLSLVQELVKLHGGTIEVTSVLNQGTTFTIAIPLGQAHLPTDRVQGDRRMQSTALGAAPFVEEAARWIVEEDITTREHTSLDGFETPAYPQPQARILLADDNADMREYVKRLLSQSYQVETVADGAAALDRIRASLNGKDTRPLPDLILSDVMMPKLDGFELLRELRADPQTQELPIILLSARAGEEARVEGLESGADDYLIKPFSARELIARVQATLKLAQLRQATAQQKRRSDERYRAFIEQSSEAIWCFELKEALFISGSEDEQIQQFYQYGYLSECNQIMAQMYGVASPQEIVGARLGDFWGQTDPNNIEYLRSFVRSNYRLADLEYRQVDQWGNPKIFLNNLVGIVEDGKLLRVWGTQRDITDRKQIEESLQNAQSQLESALEAGAIYTWRWNILENRLFVNSAFAHLFGIDPDRAVDGLPVEVFVNSIHEDDRDRVVAATYRSIETGENFTAEYRVCTANGDERWVTARGRVEYDADGRAIAFPGALADITDQKQIEEILRQREAELRLVTNSVPVLISFVDQDQRYRFNNQGYEEWYGSPANEVYGKYLWEVLGDTYGIIRPYVERVLRGEHVTFESRVTTIDGKTRDVSVTYVPRLSDRGTIEGFVALVGDISDRKRAEVERERLLVREQEAREQAESANRIKDEFLAVLSHELRTPLNPILGWSKLLRRGNLDAAKTAHALETIERNAKLQTQLIEDLLDVSRILQGKLSLKMSPVDLTATLNAALETVRLAAEAKSIQLKTQFDTTGQVLGDSARLQQVIWNLLSNAVKFTPSGGSVSIHSQSIGSEVQIQVSDTGRGIPHSFLPYVFEYFRQADGSTTRTFGGLGLGLAIVRHLVELHGGTVRADSPGENQGATFTVTLPLLQTKFAPSDDSNAPFSEVESSMPLTGMRILLVDDEVDSLELVAFVLEQAGATVISVSSAIAALDAFTQAQPDLLISDIGMPEMDGYTLIRQIRRLPQSQQVPAIALTAYAGEINHRQAIAAGFQQHLSKPVEPSQLINAIMVLYIAHAPQLNP